MNHVIGVQYVRIVRCLSSLCVYIMRMCDALSGRPSIIERNFMVFDAESSTKLLCCCVFISINGSINNVKCNGFD